MSKYHELGYVYDLKKLAPFSAEKLDEVVKFFESKGLEVNLHRV